MRNYTIPKYFFHAISAIYPFRSDAVLQEHARSILVSLTDEEYAQLLGDAKYYVGVFSGHRNSDLRKLAASANATIRALATPRA